MNIQGLLLEWKTVGLPLSLIAAAFLVGVVLNRLLYNRLQHHLAQIPGEVPGILIRSLRGLPIIWCTLGGIYASIQFVSGYESLVHKLEMALLVVILLSVTIVTARIIVGLINVYAQQAEGVFPATSIFVNLAELTIYIIGFLIILQSIGISITPILTALGVGGLAVALALQETLSNLFSGLHILLSRQFKVGDYVRLTSGEEGNIMDITWRNTTIQALSNNMIIVPNGKIASAIITNFSLPEQALTLVIPVGVSYDSDLERVEQIAVEEGNLVMQQVEGGVADFTPLVRYFEFADSCIRFNVVLKVKEFSYQSPVRHAFIKRLHVRFAAEGIEIPFPMRTIHVKENGK